MRSILAGWITPEVLVRASDESPHIGHFVSDTLLNGVMPAAPQAENATMAAQAIGIFQAKTHLSELIERVGQGQRFTITKHGRPVAELGPAQAQTARPKRGAARSEEFAMAPDFDEPLEDFAECV